MVSNTSFVAHQGGCHCGAIKFKVQAPAEIDAVECNCSICARTAYLHLMVPKARFELISGADALTTYTFNTRVAQHYFCRHCGIKSFYVPRSHPDGYSVNVRCLERTHITRVNVTFFDGQHWEEAIGSLAPLATAEIPRARLRDVVDARWSPRAFGPEPVSAVLLAELFYAVQWAPSCYNDQPWAFVVTQRGSAAHAALLATLAASNQAWAATSPLLILVLARKQFRHNQAAHRHAWYDVGQAIGGLLLTATELGLVAHQMAGFDAPAAARCLNVPDTCDAICVMALGYLGEPSRLPPGTAEKNPAERTRLPASEFVYREGFGQPFAGL